MFGFERTSFDAPQHLDFAQCLYHGQDCYIARHLRKCSAGFRWGFRLSKALTGCDGVKTLTLAGNASYKRLPSAVRLQMRQLLGSKRTQGQGVKEHHCSFDAFISKRNFPCPFAFHLILMFCLSRSTQIIWTCYECKVRSSETFDLSHLYQTILCGQMTESVTESVIQQSLCSTWLHNGHHPLFVNEIIDADNEVEPAHPSSLGPIA